MEQRPFVDFIWFAGALERGPFVSVSVLLDFYLYLQISPPLIRPVIRPE